MTRTSVDRAADSRRSDGGGQHATTQAGTPSSDPARYALAAVRVALGRGHNAVLAAAAHDLAARVHDPAHREEADELELQDGVIELPPLIITATPPQGERMPGDEARADPAGDQPDDTLARLAGAAAKLAQVRALLGDGHDLQTPETWLLATAIADLLGIAPPEEDGAGAGGSERDQAKLPEVDPDAGPHPDDPLSTGTGPHKDAAGRRGDDAEDRRRKGKLREDVHTQDAKKKALKRGPAKQKGKPKRGDDKAGPASGKGKAKGKPGADGKDAGQVKIEKATGGEASGGADVAAWKSKVDAKVGAVQAKPVPDGDRYVVTIQEAANNTPPQTDQRKIELLAEAKKAVTPVDKFEDNPDLARIPDDPCPDARAAVDKWTNKSIVKQTMPALQKTPHGRMPEIGQSMYTDKEGATHVVREISPGKFGEIFVLGPNDKPPKWNPDNDVRKEKSFDGTGTVTDKLKEHNGKEPRNLKPATGKVLGAKANDDFPLKAPVVPALEGIAKIDTEAVLTAALAGTDKHVTSILDTSERMFPGGKGLPTGYTRDWAPEIKKDVLVEFQRIQGAGTKSGKGLKDKLKTERDKAELDVQAAHEKVKDNKLLTKSEYKTAYEVVGGEIAALRDQLDKEAEERALMANKNVDGKKARADRDAGKLANEAKTSIWLGRYKKMRARRHEQIATTKSEQIAAYDAALELDRKTLKAKAGDDQDKEPVKGELAAAFEEMRLWRQDFIEAGPDSLETKFTNLDTEVDVDVDATVAALEAAGVAYEKAADDWYKTLIGFEKGFWAKVLDFVMDWLGLTKKETKSWKEREENNNTTHLANDEIWLRDLQIRHHNELTKDELDSMTWLTEEQRAIAQSYFIDAKGDGAKALAAGLVVRLGKQWAPRLGQRIEAKVLKDSPKVLKDVANHSGISVEGKVEDLNTAFKGPGTKKDIIWNALAGLTAIQVRAVEFEYERVHGYPLRAELQEELHDLGEVLFGSSHDADRAKALLDGAKSHYDSKDPTKVDKAQLEAIAIQLDATMKATFLGTGAGTDEKELLKLLRGKNPREIAEIKRIYFARYKRDLTATIQDELLDGSSPPWNWQEALAILENRPQDAEAAALRASMGHVPGGRPKKYMLMGGLVGYVASPLLEGAGVGLDDDTIINYFTRDQADAEDAMARVKADVIKDQQKYGWSEVDFKRQLDRRLKVVDDKFGTSYGGEFDAFDPKKSALDIAFGRSFSQDQAKLLTGIRTQNLAQESAARVAIERKAIFSSKKEVDRALADQYVRQYESDRRDVESEQRKEKEKEWEKSKVYILDADGKIAKDEHGRDKVDWDKTKDEQRKWRTRWISIEGAHARRKEADKLAEERAKKKAPANMQALKEVYEDEKNGFVTGGIFASGSFEGDVYSATNLSWVGLRSTFGGEGRTVDNDKTMAMMAKGPDGKFKVGGYLTGGQQLFFAVYGVGTDDDAVKKVYAGKSKEEIDEIHKDLKGRMNTMGVGKGDTAAEWVKDDFSGRDLKDIKLEQEFGEPVTADQKLAKAKRKVQLDQESKGPGVGDYILGAIVGGPIAGPMVAEGFAAMRQGMGSTEMRVANEQVALLELEVAALEQDKKDMLAKGIVEGDAAWYETINTRYERIGLIAGAVDSAINSHRAAIDAIADWTTMIIQAVMIVGAVVIGAVVTALTAGTASPFVVAALTALITAVVTSGLTIAAKVIIKGGDYGWEEFAGDLAMAAVEALLAAATANISTGLLKSGSLLGKMAAKGVVAKFIAEGIAGVIEGVVQSIPSAFLGAAIQENFDLGAIIGQIGQSAGMAGLMHMAKPALNPVLGRLGNAITKRIGPRPVAEIGSYRGSAAHTEETFKQYLKEKPGATKQDFLRELDNAMLARHQTAFGDPQTQAILRRDLLEGLPGPVRQKYAGAQIEMLTDAEFSKKFGNSHDAHVVTRNGEPVVVVRAGTELGTLGTRSAGVFEGPAAPRPHAATTEVPAPPAAKPHAEKLDLELDGGGKVQKLPERVVMEPYSGPSLDSALDIAKKAPGTKVIATESSYHPPADDVKQFKAAGHEYHGDNQPAAVPHNSVDEIKMRFPLSDVEAARVTFMDHLARVRTEHPGLHPIKQHELAMKRVETVSNHGPYALERLKPGGHMEVVYWEKQIGGEIGKLQDLTYKDPATGKTYRFQVESTQMLPKGEVAPHSGFGVPVKPGDPVHVAVVRKVEVDVEATSTKRTTPESADAQGATKRTTKPEIETEMAESRRGPREAAAVEPAAADRTLRVREQEAPLGTRAEAAAQAEKGRCAAWVWVEVMRNIGWVGAVADQPGWHPSVDAKPAKGQPRRGFGDIVRAIRDPSGNKLPRIEGHPSQLVASAQGMKPGTQIIISAKTKNGVWHAMLGVVQADGSLELTHVNRASTVRSGLSPDPAGNVMVTTRIYDAQVPELANFNSHRWWVLPEMAGPKLPKIQTDAPNVKRLLPEGERLPPRVRKAIEADLTEVGHTRNGLKDLDDNALLAAHNRAQAELAPKRIAEFRDTLPWHQKGELDALVGATDAHHKPISPQTQASLSKALGTPIHVDPALDPGEIRVKYQVGKLGNVTGLEIHLGPGATLGDALLHVGTLHSFKRYQGVTGVLRNVTDSIGRLVGSGKLPLNTRAHEAWKELQKLPALVQSRKALIASGTVDIHTRVKLSLEIEALERQIARHVGELGDVKAKGRGHVASKGVDVDASIRAKAEATDTTKQGLRDRAASVQERRGRSRGKGPLIQTAEDALADIHNKVGEAEVTRPVRIGLADDPDLIRVVREFPKPDQLNLIVRGINSYGAPEVPRLNKEGKVKPPRDLVSRARAIAEFYFRGDTSEVRLVEAMVKFFQTGELPPQLGRLTNDQARRAANFFAQTERLIFTSESFRSPTNVADLAQLFKGMSDGWTPTGRRGPLDAIGEVFPAGLAARPGGIEGGGRVGGSPGTRRALERAQGQPRSSQELLERAADAVIERHRLLQQMDPLKGRTHPQRVADALGKIEWLLHGL